MVRDPVLFDAAKYSSAIHDLSGSFDEAKERSKAVEIFYGGPTGHKIIFCKSILDVEEARIDTVSLKIPRRIVRILEQQYNSVEWGFWVALFPLKHECVRLHFSFSHPLMRNRIFVPLPVFAPKGVPFGERNDICNDEDPSWPKVTLYAANASSSALPAEETETLEASQQRRMQTDPGTSLARSGLVMTALPIELDSGRPVVLLRSRVVASRDQPLWMPLSTAFLGLKKALSAAESGNFRKASRVFADLAKHKRSSTVLAHYAAFCSSQGDAEHANDLFESAADLNRLNPEVYILLGQAPSSTNQRKVKAFQAALALDPYDSRALVGLAKSLEDDGVQAEKLLKRALLIHPSNEQAAVRLETLADESCALDRERSDQMRLFEREQRKKAMQNVSTYLKMLNQERLVLFPGQELE